MNDTSAPDVSAPDTSAPDTSVLARATVRAIGLRIMPVLAAAYFIASLDRVNVGFAALQMNHAIGLGPAQFGFGAGIFFVAYSIFALPGSLLMERIGVRRGIALVMLAWGLVSAGTAFVQGPISFYAARFLLGAAEAAFFPGVIVYLAGWLPARARGRLLSILMLGLPLASVFGSVLSGALLASDGWLGAGGWQILFIAEAAPAILLGLAAFRLLPATPAGAAWLGTEARAWLADELARERAQRPPAQGSNWRGPAARGSIWRTLRDPRVLALSLVNIGAIAVTNGMAIWQPQFIRAFGLTNWQTSLLNALPFALGCSAMYLWSWHSDHVGERRLHTALPLALGAIALGMGPFVHALAPTIVLFCAAVAAASMIKSPFWALATEIVPPERAAASFGHITSLTNIGAFIGTYGVGAISAADGNYSHALLPLMAMMALAFLCALLVGRGHARAGARLDGVIPPA